jgi:hypothetical protein
LPAREIGNPGASLPELAIPLDPSTDLDLVSGWHMNLPDAAVDAHRQELRLVALSACAPAAGVATDTPTRAEAPVEQGPSLREQQLELPLLGCAEVEKQLP